MPQTINMPNKTTVPRLTIQVEKVGRSARNLSLPLPLFKIRNRVHGEKKKGGGKEKQEFSVAVYVQQYITITQIRVSQTTVLVPVL